MADKKNAGTALWYRASLRNRVIMAISCLWPMSPIVLLAASGAKMRSGYGKTK
jgi:hypothetical protein